MSDRGDECKDHSKRLTILEIQMLNLMEDVVGFGKKLDKVVTMTNDIRVRVSEQKGEAKARYGLMDMGMMVVLGAIGSYIVGTQIV